jgi:hypothetical protein
MPERAPRRQVIARHDGKSQRVLIDLVVVAAWRDFTAPMPSGHARTRDDRTPRRQVAKVLIALAAIAAWRDFTAKAPGGRAETPSDRTPSRQIAKGADRSGGRRGLA